MKPIGYLKFFVPLQFGPRIYTEGQIVVLDKKEEVTFWCCIVWDYFSLLHSGQIKSACGQLDFFLKK